MRVGFSKGIIAAIVEQADASDLEVCGLLFGGGERVTSFRWCINAAADPYRNFEISPRQLLEAHRSARAGGPAIMGCYHSHPSSGAPVPSARDAACAAPDGALWLIAAGRGVGVWRATSNGAVQGRFDAVAVYELA